MSGKLFAEPAKLYPEPAKMYPSLRESGNPRLKETKSFNDSIQNIKDIQNYYNHEAEKYKMKSKTYIIINGLFQSIHGVLLWGVSSTCITLSVTGVGLIVAPIESGIGAGVSIFSMFIGEYLKTKEQLNIKKYTLASGTLNNFQKLHTKYLEDNKRDLKDYNKLKQTYDVYKNKILFKF